MAETVALEMVVLDLHDSFDPERLPGEVLARTPAALGSGHAVDLVRLGLRPFLPRVTLEGILPERLELGRELPAHRHGKRGGNPHVLQHAPAIVQPQQQ